MYGTGCRRKIFSIIRSGFLLASLFVGLTISVRVLAVQKRFWVESFYSIERISRTQFLLRRVESFSDIEVSQQIVNLHSLLTRHFNAELVLREVNLRYWNPPFTSINFRGSDLVVTPNENGFSIHPFAAPDLSITVYSSALNSFRQVLDIIPWNEGVSGIQLLNRAGDEPADQGIYLFPIVLNPFLFGYMHNIYASILRDGVPLILRVVFNFCGAHHRLNTNLWSFYNLGNVNGGKGEGEDLNIPVILSEGGSFKYTLFDLGDYSSRKLHHKIRVTDREITTGAGHCMTVNRNYLSEPDMNQRRSYPLGLAHISPPPPAPTRFYQNDNVLVGLHLLLTVIRWGLRFRYNCR